MIALGGGAGAIAADKKDPSEAAFPKRRLRDRLYRLYVPRALAVPNDARRTERARGPPTLALHRRCQPPADAAPGPRLNARARAPNRRAPAPAAGPRKSLR